MIVRDVGASRPEPSLRALTGEHLLAAWDRGQDQDNLRRSLVLLAAAMPHDAADDLGALPVFERDRLLLRVRALTFGPDLGAFSTCPSCAAPVEFTAPVAPMTEQAEGEATIAWIEEGRELRLRPASTLDLLASLEVAEESAAEAIVLSRCLRVDGAPVEPGEVAQWPSARAQFNQWHEAMARSFALTCPQCSESFTIPLDVPRFLWREVRHEARRLFDDVHVLAAHYGWAERDILKMNRARRAAYLERVPS